MGGLFAAAFLQRIGWEAHVYERTGDERWLDRARAFAMHALAQVEQLPARYSLFTGGIGVALYVADCIDARARFPIVDGLDNA